MTKNIKLSIKNKQLADSLNLGKIKNKLNKKQPEDSSKAADTVKEEKPKKTPVEKSAPPEVVEVKKPELKPIKKEPPPVVQEAPKPLEKPKHKIEERKPFKISKAAQRERPIDRPVIIKHREPPKVFKEVKKEATPSSSSSAANKKDLKALEKSSPGMETKSNLKKAGNKNDNRPLPKLGRNKGYQDLPPIKRQNQPGNFDSRTRHGLVSPDEGTWQRRRRRPLKSKRLQEEDRTIRPSHLSVRAPISIKNLAAAMKVKASELITVLFKQGLTLTLNDFLEDETTIQLIGHELNCEIKLNTAEQERIQITDKTLEEEIAETDPKDCIIRPPVVAFMGHVDHGKTSLIDSIRKSNRVDYEAGAITQHIGAFQCNTSHGPITVLDTPGHEAFSAMRNRGANVTDIIVLVVAGDEGIKDQTIEAIKHAKAANVTIIVALNKSDKEAFNPDEVYRGLADHSLVPEQWGGSTVMVNCSAKSGEGVPELLELIAIQSELLELKANPNTRARGMVLESEIHKGMGNVATLIVHNGTLNVGDSLVFDTQYARIKTMINDKGEKLQHATPSMPAEITGISGLPEAGSEFIVVKDEKEAKTISDMRYKESQKERFAPKKSNFQESFLSDTAHDKVQKKLLPLILRADVQGSLEALKQSLNKIETDKVTLLFINEGVGEVTESDIHLAKTAGAIIIGFHTRIESHAEELMKSINVPIKMPKIIYEAVDLVKELMVKTLDKIPNEEEKGKAEVKAIFKASRIGKIAGCQVSMGTISRNHKARVLRAGKEIWKGSIASLKREKEDVKQLKKGMECGILLENFNNVEVGDIIESFEVTYLTPTL
ncbi:MAG: Translation initiation factor IF-2 [Chlamydiae bacterium]|nr:Translation initiation factor IF-2 [Chlamydiota bacterium]